MKAPHWFLGLAGVLTVSAIALWFIRPGVPQKSQDKPQAPALMPTPDKPAEPAPSAEPIAPEAPPTQAAIVVSDANPAELVKRIAAALESGDISVLEKLLGDSRLDDASREALRDLLASKPRLAQGGGIREVGELELNKRTRWVLELEGGGRMVLDLINNDGLWSVEKFVLPASDGATTGQATADDSLAVADGFLQAVLNQKFEVARTHVNPKLVSDTKIAGLCILFEEGMYQLRKSKPLRAMLQKPDLAGYLANIETTDGSQDAGIALTLQNSGSPAKWLVSEINLDRLLADYARRVAGGDVYYSPLVKNPAGGDTLALYFGFDEDDVNPRTRRQLEIVSKILRADPDKKITLSGHTDALGTRDYNDGLSGRRAAVVRDLLIEAGVSATQIVTVAKGSSQPRRPNVTEGGVDNPDGRKVNRRTEIYLDF
ncbi:MAG: OmpA family protein [Verrucomicrobia bacterium]|jgi:outer membrane protein OmpA-like peptidoglycan-associated protein|nr:OmpA family protein [Verrucomicrobiota bacterium]